MPEGPSIVIMREAVQAFKAKKILKASGSAKIDMARLNNSKVLDFKSWGKHFLICFDGFFIRIHLLMFGTYRINERRDMIPKLRLEFKNDEVNFYTCNIKLVEGDPDEEYDWEADIMSDEWNALKAEKKLKSLKNVYVCDALLDQEIFSGVGNIIKNEVLFRTKIHPLTLVEALPSKKLKELIKDARTYSLQFYIWKKANVLKKHWLIYNKKECPSCKIKSQKDYLGKGKRLSCYCDNCQELYN